MNIFAVGKTDVGMVRAQNEDAFYVSYEDNLDASKKLKNLFVVADGMGGHNAGEIASSKSIEKFLDYVQNVKIDDDDILDFLVDAILFSNKEIYKLSVQNDELRGMGTTFSCCTIVEKKNEIKLYAAHIGDSRIYKISKNEIKQLSIDHTFVNELVKAGQITAEEARSHPKRNLVTRALGIEDSINIDAFLCDLEIGDKILICSDGLTGQITDEEINEIIQNEESQLLTVRKLVAAANESGGTDNITVILVEIAR